MSTHITKAVAGCFASLRQLRSVRRSLSQESFTRLVVALVLSRLDYCNGVLAGLPASQLSRLQSVRHAAMRQIHGVRRYDHVTPLLQQLPWLSVPERVNSNSASWYIAVCMVSALNISRRISSSYPRFHLARDCIRPPVPMSWCGSCHTPVFIWRPHISVAGARAWNALPPSVTSSPSLLIPANSENISFPATTASNCVVVLKCLHSVPR